MLILFFVITVLATVYLLIKIVAPPARFLWLLLLWLTVTGILAHFQFFADFQKRPPALPPFIAVAIAIATWFACRISRQIPLSLLVGYQAFRIPVEIFLHAGFLAGFVPIQMTWDGRNWDVLTGLTAIPIAWLAHRKALPLWALRAWNIAGFALLLNIMIVSILSLPTALRQFPNEPPNTFVAQWPYVWLPAVLVPAAWFGHIALFRRWKG